MGNGSSRNPSQQLPGQKSQGFFSPRQQVNPGMGLPPTQPSKIYDLQFIIQRPPLPIPQSIQETAKNNSQNLKKKLEPIKGILLNYNREKWKFGNKDDGQPRPLFDEITYKSFLDFVTNLINGSTQNPNANSKDANSKDKKDIVREIHNLIDAIERKRLVNQFFEVKISDIFQNIPEVKQGDTIMVTLLGLASIIGAEHIVIYLLICGADPSLTFESDNKDSATLLLAYQIAFCKILQSNPSLQNLKYSIVLRRILCILFLLGSIGEGVDLSAIFQTNEVKNKVNLSGSQKGVIVKSSILNMLVQLPSIKSNAPLQNLTLQNGASIPLLLEILERNNLLGNPKFFKDINSLETPYDLNILYNVLLIPSIDDETKLKLVELLVKKYFANISNVPTFVEKNTSISLFNIILFIIKELVKTNYPQTKASILEIFSTNPEFKKMLDTSKIDLRQFLTGNNKTNKNEIIRQLELQINLLKEKHKLILDKLFRNFNAVRVQGALLNAQLNAAKTGSNFGQVPGSAQQLSSLSANQRSAQLGKPLSSLPANPGSAQLAQQSSSLQTNPGLSQQLSSLTANPGSAQLAQQSSILPANQGFTQPQPGATSGKNRFINKLQFWKSKEKAAPKMNSSTNSTQPNKSFFNRFKLGKKENKGQASLLPSSSPNSLQSSELTQINQTKKKNFFNGLRNKTSKLFWRNKEQATAQSEPLLNSSLNPLQNPISSKSTIVPPLNTKNSALLSPVSLSGNTQNPLPISVSLQSSAPGVPTSKLNLKNNRQAGGKKIQMRTYHFLKNKKYSERAFIAERPIIAADNAYDFMKLHYDIGSKKITFTIHDRVNNKKYKYTARTLKDGTNVIKSAK